MNPPPAKTCFVVGPIGDEGTDTRARADALLKHIIKKVLEAAPFGMAVKRADEMEPGLITQQIIERVVNADLVVADLTERNANALYELALRHVTRKPVVHMLLAGQKLPFDIAALRTIYYDTRDLDVADQAKDDLRRHAEAVLKNAEAADNPISAALAVLRLRESAASTDQALARILTEVSELREELRLVRSDAVLNQPFKAAMSRIRRDALGDTARAAFLAHDKENRRALLGEIGKALADEARIIAGAAARAPTCANCGQLIDGVPGQRSADGAPIHWEGKCPKPPQVGGGVPSTSANV